MIKCRQCTTEVNWKNRSVFEHGTSLDGTINISVTYKCPECGFYDTYFGSLTHTISVHEDGRVITNN
jgi:hypothetical protein